MIDERLNGQVRELMADTFGIDESDLPEKPSQAGLARWTSLVHMVLVAALEEQFGLRFSMEEMTSMTTFDRIIDVLRQKTAAALPS